MRRRLLLLLAILAVLFAGVVWRWSNFLRAERPAARRLVQPNTDPPNVLLISLDTVRPDHLGCYGYPRPTSPNLDRFAKTAALFTQVRAQAPWTLPSHMSLFTSMLPSSNGVNSPGTTLAPEVSTFVQPLKAAGYATAAIVHSGNLAKAWGFGRGYDTYEEQEIWDETKTFTGRAEVISDRTLDWLAHAPRKPWHLFLHYFDAHDPYYSPEPFHSHFGALPPEVATRLIFDHRWPTTPFTGPHDLEALVNTYDAALAYLDAEVGRVLDHVPPHTLVVVFSDHGEAFKEHGWTWHASTVYEEGIRTVLMIRPPEDSPEAEGFQPAVIDEPVMLLDVAPTILAQCRVAAPSTFDGTDLSPLLMGGTITRRPSASENKGTIVGNLLKCLVSYPWKLVYHLDTGREELYRLPDEKHDLIASEPSIVQSMRETMRRWVDQESFWLIRFTGDGEFTGSISAVDGTFAALVPLVDGGSFQGGFVTGGTPGKSPWQFRAGPGEKLQGVFIQTLPPDAALRADLKLNGRIVPGELFVGKSDGHPSAVPREYWIGPPDAVPPSTEQRTSLGASELLPSFLDTPFHPRAPGYYIRRFGDASPGAANARHHGAPMLDQKVLDDLSHMQYLGH